MSIRHQVENSKIDLFLEQALEIMPDIPIKIAHDGDFYCTVEFDAFAPFEEANVLIFINQFHKEND